MQIAVGSPFDKWTVIGERQKVGGLNYVLCRCVCGNEKLIYEGNLRQRFSKSCGCAKNDFVRRAITKHGHTAGGKHSREFVSWCHMRQRCLSKSCHAFPDYGGRGITICDRWLGDDGFENFLADMGPRPLGCTLDRKQNDGNYEPSNCVWATRKQQSNNRRKRRWGRRPVEVQ